MKLKSVTIGGFKNVKKTRIELGNIVSIVSTNNYGKSNFLEGIDFGIDFITSSEKKRQSMMKLIRGIPIITSLAYDDYTFEIEFENDVPDEYRFIRYGFSFSWYKDDGTGCKITNEWLEARPTESVKYTSYLKRLENMYRKEKNTSSFRKINLTDLQLAIDLLASNDEIQISVPIRSIKNISYHICSSLDPYDNFQQNPIEYVEDGTNDSIFLDEQDIPRALYKLKETDRDKYNLFLEAVYSLFPEFSDIVIQPYTVKINAESLNAVVVSNSPNQSGIKPLEDIPFRIKDELYNIIITDKYLNQDISINRMSSGTRRIFWLLTNVFIASSKGISLIGIEELETSIHPKLLKNLLEFLNEALENTSVIITSHSPLLIQYIKPNNIYVGKPTIDGSAEFKKIKSSKINPLVSLSKSHDMSVGEFLFELMSGDKDSEEILSFYLED